LLHPITKAFFVPLYSAANFKRITIINYIFELLKSDLLLCAAAPFKTL